MISETHPNYALVPKVGDEAPNFTLPDTEGQPLHLASSLFDRPLVLVFYRGDWCPTCQNQLTQLAAVYEKIQAQGFDLWAISPQKESTNKAFRDKRNFPFPILADYGGEVIRAWGLLNEPASQWRTMPFPGTFVVGQSGWIEWAHVGVDVTEHPPCGEVLQVLSTLPVFSTG
ncbi:MAG: peroxiredoxin family protein [Chloroflexota bacterium]